MYKNLSVGGYFRVGSLCFGSSTGCNSPACLLSPGSPWVMKATGCQKSRSVSEIWGDE